MSFKDDIVRKRPGAFARFAAHLRRHGATHKQICDRIRIIQFVAGQPMMEDRELDALFDEEEQEERR